jgi:hypothetical protein
MYYIVLARNVQLFDSLTLLRRDVQSQTRRLPVSSYYYCGRHASSFGTANSPTRPLALIAPPQMHGNIGDYDTKSRFCTLAPSAKSTGPVTTA